MLKNLPQMLKVLFFSFFQYKEYIVSQKYYNSAKQFKTVIWKMIELNTLHIFLRSFPNSYNATILPIIA